ncbi:ATP-binding protein [Rhodococcus sp. Leaf278]|uniref:ATP-binding protein n=1 Tax=Rhodococcus sp. Leaf278 TaxID=1736319 RepID=UPI000B2F1BB6|nr:ATP-binding protein [Rhodococcus sp. Leaf278]
MSPLPEARAEFEDLVNRLVEQPAESEWLEFKQNMNDPQEIGEYISALANAAALHGEARAYLVWGVEDGTHKLVGTAFDETTLKKGNQAFQPWVVGSLSPDPGLVYYHGQVDGKRTVVLEIGAAAHSPVMFQGIAYIRIGSHKKKLNAHPVEAKQLYRNLDVVPFEHRAALSGLTEDEALEHVDHAAYYKLQGVAVPAERDVVVDALLSDKIFDREPNGRVSITNMGALLFGVQLSDYPSIARKAARVIKYKGKNKLTAEREHEGTRGYAAGFTGMVDYIDNLLPANEIIGKALRTEVSMFPPTAIREIVANALIHQDFSVGGAGPLIEIYDDRMVITNPGAPLVDPSRFVDAPPRSRNEKLAYMMRRCNICEERGSGWDRIAFEIEFHQLPAPLIVVNEGHTTVTLFSHKKTSDMDKEDRIRAVYLHSCLKSVSGEQVTNTTVRERFGLTDKESSAASAYIRETLDAGMITQYDPNAGRKHMRYVPFWARRVT